MSGKTVNKGGRPSLYKAPYADDVVEHLALGYTLASWAGSIGVSRDTVYEWANVHPEFSDAIKKGAQKGRPFGSGVLQNRPLKVRGTQPPSSSR